MNIRRAKKAYKRLMNCKRKVRYFFRDHCRDSLQFYPAEAHPYVPTVVPKETR